ncbi:MAG: EAL domain-containing protein [Gammaproteobacteria bacterium]|nr:MAG: EAL domain-containing protein [Gammaproteobacteria bacterium]
MSSIDIFPWNDNFATGIGRIDEQHQHLVEILNDLATHVAFPSRELGLDVILASLVDYTRYHFATEESIWGEYLAGDQTETAHSAEHQAFIASIHRQKEEAAGRPTEEQVPELLSLLTRWLASHILEKDRYLAKVVLNCQTGLDLETAKARAAEGMQGSASVLVSLVLAIYSSLTANTTHLIREIAERRRVEQELRAADECLKDHLERIKMLVDASPDGVIELDGAGRVTGWNAQAERIFGWRTAQILGEDFAAALLPPLFREAQRQWLARALAASPALQPNKTLEIAGLRADGAEFPLEITLAAMKRRGEPVFVAYARDITERKEILERIAHLSSHDSLTKLPNRQLLAERLNLALAASARHLHQAALLLIDLDNFRALNETLGHGIGDLLLQEVARRLQDQAGPKGTVARLGGDEFIVLLEELSPDAEQAQILAAEGGKRILAALNASYQLAGHDYLSTPSIGLVLFGRDPATTTPEELLKKADIAMYQAKTQGRNRLCVFDPEMESRVSQRAFLATDLRRALANDEFVLHYQVQVATDSRPLGAEALLRWRHPERGMVSPLTFIPLAEETGLIVPIGQWVLDQVCARLKEWEGDPRLGNLQLAVNVSPRQLRDLDFVDAVRRTLRRQAIAPDRLKLELTEGAILADVGDSVRKMNALKSLGVSFSLDDFGTGYSSLAYLTQLPLSQLKIDQAFVHNIGIQATDDIIVRTIIGMADSLSIEVVAEGVETQAQRDFLEAEGCGIYQGYLYSKPLPLADIVRLVRQRGRREHEEGSAEAIGQISNH